VATQRVGHVPRRATSTAQDFAEQQVIDVVGASPAASMTAVTVCMPMSATVSPARARPERPIGVRWRRQ